MVNDKFSDFKPSNNEEKNQINLLDPDKMPNHIAVIMDGNGRWAKSKGFLDRIIGHKEGTKSVNRIVTACAQLHISALTLFAFSMENWNRPKKEINALMNLLEEYLIKERPTLKKNNVSLIASGRLDMLPKKTISILNETIDITKNNKGLKLNLALSYGGRTEIIDAALKLYDDLLKKKIDINNINERSFSKYFYQPDIHDPDLLIRTSGELRVSNFLLWQIAYTEIYITPVLWPDFSVLELLKAINDYQKRDRRFGRVSSSEV